jgi:colanic acid biosynthesis glycosyl transferase WcaI
MRLWVVSELYYPELTSTGYFMTGVAEGLATGREVRVLCSQPTYSARGTLAPETEVRNGVRIERCAGTRFDKDRLLLRLVNLVTISAAIGWRVLRRVRRGDVVIVVTNPPSLPFVVWAAARLRGARVVLRIEDVYPEVLVAAGMAGPRSGLVRVVGAATRQLYRRMERVIVLGRDMHALAAAKMGDRADRVVHISNWGEVGLVTPRPRAGNPVLARLGVLDRFVVQYMGNMGRTHGVDALGEAASRLRDHPRLHFLFVGWGARKAALEQRVASEGLRQVSILPGCPQEELADHANACDLSVIAFQAGMAGVSVPSRMYNVMAAGKPILAAAEAHSELAQVVTEERIGWVVPPGDVDALVAAIRAAADLPAPELAAMGARAREAVERKYAPGPVVTAYLALADELERAGA